jgi:hypothetical protein
LNLDGEVIGINAAIESESGGFEGIGFAIPSNMATHIARQRHCGHREWENCAIEFPLMKASMGNHCSWWRILLQPEHIGRMPSKILILFIRRSVSQVSEATTTRNRTNSMTISPLR